MNKLYNELVINISSFLQRTDKVSYKITNKLNNNLINLRSIGTELNDELKLYIKNIFQMDYAWKSDYRYFSNVKEENTLQLEINNEYLVTKNLWYFDFSTVYDLDTGTYVFFFNTTLKDYKITIGDILCIDSINNFEDIEILTFEVKKAGKIKINCREITKYKNNIEIRYMAVVPKYYFDKIITLKEYWLKYKKF